jgi:DNA-binding transcriptional regulator YhcF (GntR family)/predicted kinase
LAPQATNRGGRYMARKELVREGVAEQITRQIRDSIHAGRLRHGQALPSTRQLAEEWGVSAKTINAALAPLITEGLVISRDRAGRTVNAPWQGETPTIIKPERPQIILIGGYAGSGKTELGRMIVRETGWGMFDKDTTTRAVVEAALVSLGQPPSDRESDTYLNIIRPAEYEALMDATAENVACGASVVATAPFIQELSNPGWLSQAKARFDNLGANLNVVWVACDADSMRAYIRHRDARRDDWKLANWDAYLAPLDLNFRPEFPHVVIDNSQGNGRTLRDQVKELVANVSRPAQ